MDFSSSTEILEQLNTIGKLKKWQSLLMGMREFLEKMRPMIEVYKFIGDGWIFFVNEETKGDKLVEILRSLHEEYLKLHKRFIADYLSLTIKGHGVSFGVDHGLVYNTCFKEENNCEYIGRPINVAVRLQSGIGENLQQQTLEYKCMFSKPAFSEYFGADCPFQNIEVKIKLKNINNDRDSACVGVSFICKTPPKQDVNQHLNTILEALRPHIASNTTKQNSR